MTLEYSEIGLEALKNKLGPDRKKKNPGFRLSWRVFSQLGKRVERNQGGSVSESEWGLRCKRNYAVRC
jgi:hypothetical protein